MEKKKQLLKLQKDIIEEYSLSAEEIMSDQTIIDFNDNEIN